MLDPISKTALERILAACILDATSFVDNALLRPVRNNNVLARPAYWIHPARVQDKVPYHGINLIGNLEWNITDTRSIEGSQPPVVNRKVHVALGDLGDAAMRVVADPGDSATSAPAAYTDTERMNASKLSRRAGLRTRFSMTYPASAVTDCAREAPGRPRSDG